MLQESELTVEVKLVTTVYDGNRLVVIIAEEVVEREQLPRVTDH